MGGGPSRNKEIGPVNPKWPEAKKARYLCKSCMHPEPHYVTHTCARVAWETPRYDAFCKDVCPNSPLLCEKHPELGHLCEQHRDIADHARRYQSSWRDPCPKCHEGFIKERDERELRDEVRRRRVRWQQAQQNVQVADQVQARRLPPKSPETKHGPR